MRPRAENTFQTRTICMHTQYVYLRMRTHKKHIRTSFFFVSKHKTTLSVNTCAHQTIIDYLRFVRARIKKHVRGNAYAEAIV